eukprot:9472816-Pyramimonas_sp.AAC.1
MGGGRERVRRAASLLESHPPRTARGRTRLRRQSSRAYKPGAMRAGRRRANGSTRLALQAALGALKRMHYARPAGYSRQLSAPPAL